VAAVGALIVCQGLIQIAFSGFQPLVVLRLLEHLSNGVAAVTGAAFAASGLGSALASLTYSRIARRYGYRLVAIVAALAMAGAQLLAAYGPGVPAVVAGAALAGVFYGTVGPAISTMIGLETPSAVQARVFGVASSATAVGFAVGPFGGGVLAARLGTMAAVTACAACAVVLASVLATRVREPRR
jgi:MFS family permease